MKAFTPLYIDYPCEAELTFRKSNYESEWADNVRKTLGLYTESKEDMLKVLYHLRNQLNNRIAHYTEGV